MLSHSFLSLFRQKLEMEAEIKTSVNKLSFDNIEVAFDGKSDQDITRAYWLFRAINSNLLVRVGPQILKLALALRLPVLGIVKATIFRQFCGGENIKDCMATITKLSNFKLGSVLDYSVEGEENEDGFEHTCTEICDTIKRSKGDSAIPFCVFKMTGIARFGLLEKMSVNSTLTDQEHKEAEKIKSRLLQICSLAHECKVRVFIDAEESWIQNAIDIMTDEMMEQFNKGDDTIVFNTIQLYRHDRLQFLKSSYQKSVEKNYKLGLKLVRGAYMEKERERASKNGYPSPIQPDQNSTNKDYDDALAFCMDHLDSIELCAGTHNEKSCYLLAQLMDAKNISTNDDRIWFSQLLGMSDHISYNLAYAGYNVAKYVPYGPVTTVLPYLIRRAQENTSISGQMGRELKMILSEKKRRKKTS